MQKKLSVNKDTKAALFRVERVLISLHLFSSFFPPFFPLFFSLFPLFFASRTSEFGLPDYENFPLGDFSPNISNVPFLSQQFLRNPSELQRTKLILCGCSSGSSTKNSEVAAPSRPYLTS
jgi:hypothetical protein